MIVFVALCNEIDDLCEEVTGCSRLHAMGAHCCRSCAPRAHAAWGPSQLHVARHAFHACAQCKGGGFVLTVQAKAKFYAPLLLYGEGEASENIEDGDAQVRIGRMLPFLQVCVCVMPGSLHSCVAEKRPVAIAPRCTVAVPAAHPAGWRGEPAVGDDSAGGAIPPIASPLL